MFSILPLLDFVANAWASNRTPWFPSPICLGVLLYHFANAISSVPTINHSLGRSLKAEWAPQDVTILRLPNMWSQNVDRLELALKTNYHQTIHNSINFFCNCLGTWCTTHCKRTTTDNVIHMWTAEWVLPVRGVFLIARKLGLALFPKTKRHIPNVSHRLSKYHSWWRRKT